MDGHDHFRVISVGDLMIGEHPLSIGRGVLTSWLDHGREPFALISKQLLEGNIVLGNLESVISDVSEKQGYAGRSLRAPPIAASLLKAAGFSVLSIANNHALDHGPSAFDRTCQALQTNGIEPCGLYSDPVVKTLHSEDGDITLRVAIFGASFRPNHMASKPPYRLISNSNLQRKFVGGVRDASRENDIVILQCHWGDEFIHIPSPLQRKWATELIDAGADIIIGHHPHVYQGMEVIRGKPVYYSLGNFLSDMTQPYLRLSAMGQIDIDSEKQIRSTRKPVRLDHHHRPRLSEDVSDRGFLDHVDELVSSFWDTNSSRDYQKLAKRARARYRRDIRREFLFGHDKPMKKIWLALDHIGRLLMRIPGFPD